MCHVEQSTGRVALHTHVLGSSKTGERHQGARLCNLGLVVVVRGKVGDAADGVALHFDVGAEHLADQGFQTTELDDEQLVLGLTARLPRAALAARCTSTSWLCRRNMMGSSVSRPTSRTSFSVISANASAALLCRSTLSLKESVDNALRGSP